MDWQALAYNIFVSGDVQMKKRGPNQLKKSQILATPVRREGNVLTGVCLSVHRWGGYPMVSGSRSFPGGIPLSCLGVAPRTGVPPQTGQGIPLPDRTGSTSPPRTGEQVMPRDGRYARLLQSHRTVLGGGCYFWKIANVFHLI